MKRLIVSITVLFLLTCLSLSCEKDDICAEGTPTTPSIVVGFYDRDNPDELVNVINFKYYAVGVNDTLPNVPDGQATSFNEIELPLRTDATTTKWGLIYNRPLPNGQFVQNTDFVEFNYTTQQAYVSRACGYKTTFTLNPVTPEIPTPNPLITDNNPADGFWIDNIEVLTTNILDKNETHIKIYL